MNAQDAILEKAEINGRQIVWQLAGYYPQGLDRDRIQITISRQTGQTNGRLYVRYATAFLSALGSDDHGHNYKIFLDRCDMPAGIDDAAAAVAITKMLFADAIAKAANLDVAQFVRNYNEQTGDVAYTVNLTGAF